MPKLFFSPASPYVRKVMVLAHETGQADAIERIPAAAGPVKRNPDLVAENPIGKVPTLVTDDGQALYDSRVICEYLDASSRGARLFPASGPARWTALAQQALGDGLLDAALLIRYEVTLRPEPLRWAEWQDGQMAKITSVLDEVEHQAAALGDTVTIGTVALACALGYLDFRFGEFDWRRDRPATAAWFAAFGRRPSMVATQPA